ncbi:MAG: V-type ATP synthase subunit A [Candidatus Ratteibacteria bacterium]|jgi:V/A-type H+-transporting ATPase subunit A
MRYEKGKIEKISGPLVEASGLPSVRMFEVVKVGEENLLGEVVRIREGILSIQVYKETRGLKVGDPVIRTGGPMTVELGPGLLGAIFDGIQVPLLRMEDNFIARNVSLPSLDREILWDFEPVAKVGDSLEPGDLIGVVEETPLVLHRIMVPPGISGTLSDIRKGKYSVAEPIAQISQEQEPVDLRMFHTWPVRQPRPYKRKLVPNVPLVTGQRVIDTLFPIMKGGTACIPGPFGSGKTVVLQQIAKWTDSKIVIYVGCGERGNEMADVLIEFPSLQDPESGRPLMERTTLVANTSNMPVAAREASIYTGITIAEYFRDMGFSVALMADSTSRWAEALREISGRMEEMPGEEGYPAYLGTRLAAFYERAGRIECLDGKTEGALSIIGAVSPPGGDLTDPVVQMTLRVVKVFWGLDDQLAFQRHFPAINWLTSYSLYQDNIRPFLEENLGTGASLQRKEALMLLERESELNEIVRLIGMETLSQEDRLLLATAKSIREDFLHQSAFDQRDAYTTLSRQHKMLGAILLFHQLALSALTEGWSLEKIFSLEVREKIAGMHYFSPDSDEEFELLVQEIKDSFTSM